LAVAVAVALTVTQQLSPHGAPPPAAPTANAAELANSAAVAAAAQSIPTPRPNQWVYTKELRVESKGGRPFTTEQWIRVDGKKFAYPTSSLRAARARKVTRERWQLQVLRERMQALGWKCPPGKPQRVPPAVGLGRFFPDPSAVPTDPDGLLAAIYQLVQDNSACTPIPGGDTVQDRAFLLIDAMLQTVMPPDVRAALYRALAKIPGVTVVQDATDAAGRRGVAFAHPAAIEGRGSSGWLRLEIILDSHTYRYLGARHIVTRDHFTPAVGGPRGTWFRMGQVLVSRAQLALAVVNAPCQRPGETTTCTSYVETSWVGR
jgi:hypothetical protein